VDVEIFEEARRLFHKNWKKGFTVRLLGVQTSGFDEDAGQMNLLDPKRDDRWKQALAAADKVRDRFGESSVGLATGMKGGFRERTHENPASLPGKKK
jgi:DNA polymerase-4